MLDESVRASLETALTEEYAKTGQEEVSPPPAAPEPAAAEPVQAEPEPGIAPEPEPEKAPAPLILTDKSLVTDPADGQVKEWGKIKSERMAHSAATKKFMEAAEIRREAENIRAQFLLQQEQAALQASRAGLPALPDDDPYTVHVKAQQAQLDAIAKSQAMAVEQIEQRVAAREMEASQAALDALEKQVALDFKLGEKDVEKVFREFYFRNQAGEQITVQDVAKERQDEISALKAAAIEEFKSKHRTSTPAATVAIPASGTTADEPPPPHTRARSEYLRDLLVGAR